MYVNIRKRLARQAENHKTARHFAGDQLTGFHIVFEYDDTPGSAHVVGECAVGDGQHSVIKNATGAGMGASVTEESAVDDGKRAVVRKGSGAAVQAAIIGNPFLAIAIQCVDEFAGR